ncbi:MAG: Ig-like domain-containing protein [Bacteroidota bacterium]
MRDSIIGGGCVDTAMITVNVAPQPMLSSRDTTICSGDTLNLNDLIVRLFPSGDSLEYGTSYGVYSGDSLVFPTMPTEYFIRDSVGALTCSDTTRLLVTVQATPELVGRDTSICNGETIDLSLLVTSTVGGDSIVYGTAYGVYGTSMNNIQMPSDTTTYFLRDSVGMIGCVDTAMITVNVAPQPSLNSRDTAICSGDSLDLVVLLERGQQGDSLEFGLNNYGVFTFTNPKVLPPSNVTSVYYVRDSIGATGCFDTTAITVLANVQPQIQGRDTAICSGQTILLSDLVTVTTAGQGLEYGLEYGNYVSSNSQSPLATRTFFLRDSFNMSGCADTTMLTVEVFPQPSLSSRDTTICSGDTLDLNDIIVRMLPGGDSLEYGTAYGVYGEDNLVFPTVTTEYFVRDSVGALTCSDTTRILVTVQATPELVGRDTSICSGETIDLSLLVNSTVGGDSIAYGIAYGVYGTSMDNMQTPTDTTTYFLRDSVIGVGCVDTAMITVNVAPQPMIIGRDTTICSGETINLIGLLTQGMLGDSLEFGTAYGVYGSSSLVNPSATQVYFIRDSVGALGCSDTARITVNVIPTPQITGRDTAICDGQTVNLKNLITSTVAGDSLTFGTSYGIYGAAADSLVMPSDTTVYYIRDSVGSIGCVDTAQFTVFVGQQPSFTVTNPTICLGDTVDLNLLVTGAINPLEFGFDGQSYNVPNLVSPTDTIIYRVRDSSAMTGCAALGLIRVYVNSPQATPITGPNEVCVEDTIQLVANPLGGVQPYADTTWLTSNALVATVNTLGAVIGVSAGTANIQYILIDGFGCRDTSAIFSVTVNANPVAGTITGPNQVCVGLQIDVDSAVTGFFPPFEVTYFSTNPAVATIDTAGIIDGLTGGTTEVYYTVTDNKSCMATSDSTLITVNSLPTIGFTVSDADSTICLGDTVTFTANGGNQYEFLVYNISQGASSTTPTYVTDTLQNNDPVKVIVTTAAGCVDTSAVIVMTVNPLPVATLVSDDADNVIGVNKPIIFTSTGGTNYEFSINGTSVQGPSAIDTLAMDTLTISSPLEVEVTDGNGCVDSAALFIVINKIPTAQNDTFLILEDSPNDTFNIQLNDSDPEGDMLTTIILANTLNGTSSTINMDSIQYLPNTNYNGLDSIQYQICDPFANCDTAWMHLIIQSIPDTPMANPDFIIVLEDSPATIVDVQANDSDADEDSLITSITALPVKGTATVLMDSTISYVPMMDSTGTDVIIYQVCDTSGLCSETFVQITILPVNDAPVAVKDSVVIPEDTTNVKIAVLANDFDVDGDAITIDSLFATTSGVAYTVTNDTINYGPLNNFNGLDSIQYIICDTALCDTNFVIINVLPVNDPPVAVKDSLVVSEDTSNVKIAILVNDLDLDGDSLTIDSLFAATSGATVTLTTDTLCYTPPSNFNGLDSIKYIVSDGALTDSTFVMINVLSINDQPIAVNDTVTVLEDANPAIIAVQANDSDLDGDLFGTSIVTAPTQGSAIQSGGNINYMPTLNFNGVDSLEYRICDTGTPSLCDTAKVYITIQPVNDVPVAANDTICIPEDTLFALVPVLNNDVDIDGDALQISIITSAQHSMADSVVSGDTLFYRPVLNYNGLDSVQYRASDGTLADSAWVYIKISPVNDAPVAVKDSLVIFEDSMNVDIVVTANDIDVDAGDKLTATVFVQPKSGGTAVVLNDSTVRYNPPTNFNGVDTIVYLVCDTSALCDLDTIIVVVQPVSEAPIAVDDNLTVPEDTLNVVLDVQANDSDGDGDTFVTSIISSTMIADTLNGDSIRFSLPQDDTGIQLIAYQICDPTGLCDTALVTIFVTPINDAPIARPDTLMINQDTTNVKIPVALNDTDVDDDSLTVTVVGNPTTANGTATILAPDSILYTPMAGYSGLDTIAYTICDTSGLCANSFVFVLVGFVNTPPSAINDTLVGIAEDTPSVTLNVLSNDSDIDGIGDTLKVTIVGVTASGGAVSIVGDSTLQYSPPLNFNGMDSVLYTVCDTSMGCASATAYFMVTPVNDAPVAVKDTVALNRDTMNAGIVVKANDTDIDGDALTVESLGASKRGVTYTISNDSLFYTPGSGFVGVDTICYAISDGSLKDTALLLIIITDPNNIPPIAVNDMVTTAPNVVINIDVQANDTEPNGDVLTTTILSGPAAGNTATVLANDSIQYQANIGFVGNDTIRYVVCDPSLTCDTAMVLISVENALRVTAKVLLEGPFDGTIGFMHDSLRKLNLIPTTEPYSTLPTLAGAYQFIYKNGGGGETVANPAAVFADNGSNSIVDWVFVELLRASDTIPVASRAGLLQRNGNIVDIDGTSPLTFQQLPDGDYFLSVRHRNHLGVMTKNQVNFTAGSVVLLDFSTIGATDAFGTYAMDTIANRLVLWAGDGKPDRQIIYNGGANDRDAVFNDIFTDPLNTGSNYNHVSKNYHQGDFDMKGTSIYLGSGNDPDIIFFNVFLHPGNVLNTTLFIIREQIPR